MLSGRNQFETARILDECLIATDTYTWSLLRRSFGKSAAETQETMIDMMNKAIGTPAGGDQLQRMLAVKSQARHEGKSSS